jgi:hypothetical protein
MSNITLAEQIKNVGACMTDAECRLMLDWGKTADQAQKLIAANLGMSLLNRWYPWWRVADEYVGAHRQWQELLVKQEQEWRDAERDARAALLATCPFQSGDQVRRRDGTIGIVRYAFVQTGHPDRVKIAVDWPAPNRIGGDGWRRSTVLASALTLAT